MCKFPLLSYIKISKITLLCMVDFVSNANCTHSATYLILSIHFEYNVDNTATINKWDGCSFGLLSCYVS